MGLAKTIQNLLGYNRTSYSRSVVTDVNEISFSQFGNRITRSDMVKTAIFRVCEAVSKCEFKSVLEKQSPHRVEVLDDDINAVINGRVNPLCTMKDFLYKCTWLLLTNENCFIYWQYHEEPITKDGKQTGYVKRITDGFYPIEAANVRIYMVNNEWRVEMSDANREVTLDMPYSEIIHIRHNYGANKYLGGNQSGNRDNKDLLDNLQTMHVIRESIPKSLEASLSLKGILSMKTVADADAKKVSRDEFEEHLFDSKYGIVATDYESDFTPINVNATDIPSNTLNYLRDEILAPFGVSLPIYQGKYTDAEYSAFYQTTVEGILVEIAQAMTAVLFTPRQLSYGHKIKYYDRIAQSLSFETRLKMVTDLKDSAVIDRDEQRELIGYEADGKPTPISLNYIDQNYATQYQLAGIQPQEDNKEENNNERTNN